MGWMATFQQHKIDNQPSFTTLTWFISISHLQVVVYPWEYWSNGPSGECSHAWINAGSSIWDGSDISHEY